MDLVFVVAMRTGEHCVSVTGTEHAASVQFYFGDGENSSIDQSVAIFFIKPYVLITLYMRLSPPLQSPVCHHLFSSFVTTPVLHCTVQNITTSHPGAGNVSSSLPVLAHPLSSKHTTITAAT